MVCYKYFGYIETNIIRNHLIKQTIMKELKTAFTEQIADEGAYLTQAAEVTDEERLFVKRRIKIPDESPGLWFDASAEEKAEHDGRMSRNLGSMK